MGPAVGDSSSLDSSLCDLRGASGIATNSSSSETLLWDASVAAQETASSSLALFSNRITTALELAPGENDCFGGEGSSNALNVDRGVPGLEACELGLVASPPSWRVGVGCRDSCGGETRPGIKNGASIDISNTQDCTYLR